MSEVMIVGLSGGSCSGKTTLARSLLRELGGAAALLMFDDYYRDLSHLSSEERAQVNFDHPDSLDVDLFAEHLACLSRGEHIDVPVYDFATHTRPGATHRVESRPVVLVDGILLLSLAPLRERVDLAVFVDAPEPVRLERRLARDIAERGRDEDGVRAQFAATVAPMHDAFVAPSRRHADIVFEHPFGLSAATGEVVAEIASRVAVVGPGVRGAVAAERRR